MDSTDDLKLLIRSRHPPITIETVEERRAEDGDLDSETLCTELQSTRPLSVTLAERVAKLRAWVADRCVPAD